MYILILVNNTNTYILNVEEKLLVKIPGDRSLASKTEINTQYHIYKYLNVYIFNSDGCKNDYKILHYTEKANINALPSAKLRWYATLQIREQSWLTRRRDAAVKYSRHDVYADNSN